MKHIKFFFVDRKDRLLLTEHSCICFGNTDVDINTEVAKKYPDKIILRFPKDDYSKEEALKKLREKSVISYLDNLDRESGVVIFPISAHIDKSSVISVIKDGDGNTYIQIARD